MKRDMETITAGVIKTILATDPLPLPSDPLPLPGDPIELFGDSMRRVILWQAGEIDRLNGIIKEAIRSVDGFEQTQDAELHGMLEESQGILYSSGLAAAEAAEGK